LNASREHCIKTGLDGLFAKRVWEVQIFSIKANRTRKRTDRLEAPKRG